uniref:Kinesin-like protein n=1 Tax=Leersia perrieri TaxID=77586 RepID=A0A0D9WN28_9ORYZ
MASRHRRALPPPPPPPWVGKAALPEADEVEAAKESVTVTVRFRPLRFVEQRRLRGLRTAKPRCGASTIPILDRVFGPTTATCHIYDDVAQYVVSGAMKGINGTIFAYGVTSSGKTHTMHGDQKSPGVIPLAVKDIFNRIQETPNREFLLRVSYLEIYNEVVNDLLNPAGQNLRIREDLQGTFVEGIKEEVVLSPVHVLSLIAAGEESSPCGQSNEEEAVTFSQLNLIDLAGSESLKVETTGVRQKEGSYINKSLLTLGTVISKLTDDKTTHIPFRDSKLTRLLKSSLSGQGRVSLICTVTPASSNFEETHNTLKFAHRAKHIEIQATQNKIMDARSLIKKYQNEICQLKDELAQLRRSIFTGAPLEDTTQKNIIFWKEKLEDGNVKLQYRLEQEEAAKAALLEKIERLTKLILVSTKAGQTTKSSQHSGLRRRHSFGEEELSYLPYEKRDISMDNENNMLFIPIKGVGDTFESSPKEEMKNRKGLLNWLKLLKCDSGSTNLKSSDGENLDFTKSLTALSTPLGIGFLNVPSEQRMPDHMLAENVPANLLCFGHGEFPSASLPAHGIPLVSRKTSDHVDLLREQFNILSGEVALHQNVLKRLSEESRKGAMNEQVEMEMKVVNDEIKLNKQKIASLERRISHSTSNSRGKQDNLELTLPYIQIPEQHNEKAFELEVEIGELKQRVSELTESKTQLDSRNQKLLEENRCVEGLVSATGVELKALSIKVTKLMKQNERLSSELASGRNSTQRRVNHGTRGARRESHIKRYEAANKGDMNARSGREQALEAMLMEKDQRQAELHTKIEESKQKEAFLERELVNMWAVLANLKKPRGTDQEDFDAKYNGSWA